MNWYGCTSNSPLVCSYYALAMDHDSAAELICEAILDHQQDRFSVEDVVTILAPDDTCAWLRSWIKGGEVEVLGEIPFSGGLRRWRAAGPGGWIYGVGENQVFVPLENVAELVICEAHGE